MNILTGKHVDRRAILRGLGTAIALPFLDAMSPALAAPTKAVRSSPARIAVVYVPNGIIMNQWKPSGTGGLRVHADPQTARAISPGHHVALRACQ